MTLDEILSLGFDRSSEDDEDGIRVRCSGCEAVVINGVPCHEGNCPNLRRAELRDDDIDAEEFNDARFNESDYWADDESDRRINRARDGRGAYD